MIASNETTKRRRSSQLLARRLPLTHRSKKAISLENKELEGTIGRGNTLGGLQSTEIQVLQFLGSGGEGKVFLGRITELDQLVAFKSFEIVENEEQERKIMEAIKKEMKIV